jgi:hypothetical protein
MIPLMSFRKYPFLVLALAAGSAFAQQGAQTPPHAAAPSTATKPPSSSATSSAATPHASEVEVRKLFEAMRLRENNQKFLESLLPILEQQAKQQTAGFASMDDKDRDYLKQIQQEEATKLLDPTFLNSLIDAAVPAYTEHLSSDDVKAITAFYSSPAGQHFQQQMPEISKQSQQAAVPLVQQRAREVAEDQRKKLDDYMSKKYGTTAPKPTLQGLPRSQSGTPAPAPKPDTTTPAPKSDTTVPKN